MAPGIALAALAALATAGCLDPLVSDDPGASANILPSSAVIPSISGNIELTNQITLNDGLDSVALAAAGGTIVLQPNGTAMKDATTSVPVSWWAFGHTDAAPAPIYVFGTGDPNSDTDFKEIAEHPPLVEVVPGDRDYEVVHSVFRVQVTAKYNSEKITTPGALADAIDLGLVEAPVAIKRFVNWPIVRPGTRLQVSPTATALPRTVYAHGYQADSYVLGGDFSQQSNPFGLLPTSQVSFVRRPMDGDYDRTRPIFQTVLPTPAMPGYTPVSIVVKVDLTPAGAADSNLNDAKLFTRSPMNGQIMSVNPINVANFAVTSETLDLQIQLTEGKP